MSTEQTASGPARLSIDGRSFDLPIRVGAEGERAIDIGEPCARGAGT